MKITFGDREVDPRIDFVFKKILGDPAHSHLTLHFINALMRQLGRPEFGQVTIVDPHRSADSEDGKEIILDVHAWLDGQREVQVEMQIRVYAELPVRILDNWTRLYARQLKKGQNYQKHCPLYAVWIVDQRWPDQGQWLRVFELRDQLGLGLCDHLNIILLDLAAWRENLASGASGGKIDGALDRWLELLGSRRRIGPAGRGELPLFAQAEMQEVWDIMETMSKSDRNWYLYEAHRNAVWEREALEREGYANGLKRGEEVGRLESKREAAAKLKALGVAVDIICQATGLSRDEVIAL